MSNFHSLEVVDRGSETQLQVGENNVLTWREKGFCYRLRFRDKYIIKEVC